MKEKTTMNKSIIILLAILIIAIAMCLAPFYMPDECKWISVFQGIGTGVISGSILSIVNIVHKYELSVCKRKIKELEIGLKEASKPRLITIYSDLYHKTYHRKWEKMTKSELYSLVSNANKSFCDKLENEELSDAEKEILIEIKHFLNTEKEDLEDGDCKYLLDIIDLMYDLERAGENRRKSRISSILEEQQKIEIKLNDSLIS